MKTFLLLTSFISELAFLIAFIAALVYVFDTPKVLAAVDMKDLAVVLILASFLFRRRG
jgi:hypothetical protein